MTQTYIGVKVINAEPMTRQVYNDLRGWSLPKDANEADEGYLVEYTDGGSSNVEGYAGYISWSPADVFNRAYRPVAGMTFGLALEALKKGLKVTREAINFEIELKADTNSTIGCVYLCTYPDDRVELYHPSQLDLYAEDWQVVS